MYKKRLFRAPLFGLLAVLIVPAAAQAHHINLVAECDASANVNWRVEFVGFSAAAKPTTTGTIKLDGNVVQAVPGATIDFSTSPGTLSGSLATAGNQAHVVRAEFSWMQGSGLVTDTEEKSTAVCPSAPPSSRAASASVVTRWSPV
ncbi:MAG: hypothetical protein H0W08_19325 [Acidobacteria bacterium]|nr:hypothetical protein [Acidobacteriota bacterium]